MPKNLKKFWRGFRRTLQLETKLTIGCVLAVILGFVRVAIAVMSIAQDERVFGTIVGIAYIAIALIALRIAWFPEDDPLPAKRRK